MTLNVNLFGKYGCGKGTQKARLMAIPEYQLTAFETGEMIRNEIKNETPLGKKVKSIIERGDLIPDEDIENMFENFLESASNDQGIIFDGLPRTLAQKDMFDAAMQKFERKVINIELGISDETSLTRQITREDDRAEKNEATAKKRIEVYKEQIQPVIDAYKNEGKMHTIDGEQSIDEVFSQITKIIETEWQS